MATRPFCVWGVLGEQRETAGGTRAWSFTSCLRLTGPRNGRYGPRLLDCSTPPAAVAASAP